MAYSDNYDNMSKESNTAGNAKAAQYSQQQSSRSVPRTPPTPGGSSSGSMPGTFAPGSMQGMPPGMMQGPTSGMMPGTSAPGSASSPGMMPPSMEQPMPPRTAAVPQGSASSQTPMTVSNQYYLPAYLRNFIGRDVRVEFLMGTTGPLIDRIGTLMEIGASYIVLRPIRSNDLLTCDLYSIKFVTIYNAPGNFSTPY